MIDYSKIQNKEELFQFLKANKDQLVAQKKFEMKKADAFSYAVHSVNEKTQATKAIDNAPTLLTKDKITVRTVINTTKLLDSHNDVHIDGLWKKTLKEQKSLYLLQEHQMKFDHIISDKVIAFTEEIAWKDLGFDFEGNTEALIFESEIDKVRNPFMFEQYARGYVKNHSVGMRYVQLHLCINSEEDEFKDEKNNWNKYIQSVINKDVAEEMGYFWAVTEAKAIEGSAVPMGSNWATPTQSVKAFEPSDDTQSNIQEVGSSSTPKTMFRKFNKLKK